MAEHESIVKDGVVSWPDAKEVHGRICDLLQAKGIEHETKGTRMTGPSVCEGSARKGGLNEAPAREKPRVAPAPQRRVLDTGAHGGIYVNPPPAGPPPARVRGSRVSGYQPSPATGNAIPPQGGTGETPRSGDSGLVIRIDVDADEAIKKLKSIQREARKAAQALRELGEAANAHTTVIMESIDVDTGRLSQALDDVLQRLRLQSCRPKNAERG